MHADSPIINSSEACSLTHPTGGLPAETRNRVDVVESVKQQSKDAALQKKTDYIRGLMEAAADEARSMVSVDQSESVNREWEDIADVLDTWASMPDEELNSFVTVVNDMSADAQLFPIWKDDGSGELQETKLLLDKDIFLGSGKTDIDKIGFLIHEAAHQVFYNRHPNWKEYAEENGETKDRDFFYNYHQEEFAYTKQFDFISQPYNRDLINSFRRVAYDWSNPRLKPGILESHIRNSLAIGFGGY